MLSNICCKCVCTRPSLSEEAIARQLVTQGIPCLCRCSMPQDRKCSQRAEPLVLILKTYRPNVTLYDSTLQPPTVISDSSRASAGPYHRAPISTRVHLIPDELPSPRISKRTTQLSIEDNLQFRDITSCIDESLAGYSRSIVS